jgi:hypothetical protein
MFARTLLNTFSKSLVLLLAIITLVPTTLPSYSAPTKGENVEVFFNSASPKAGSKTDLEASFGYDNKNTTKILIGGNDNIFTPGNASRGQITEFKKGRQDNAFKVGIACGETLEWSLTSPNGTTSKAKAEAPRCGSVAPETKDGKTDYTPKPSDSTCIDPKGWIEDETKKSETGKYYFVPKNSNISQKSNPKDNPDDYRVVVCSFTTKVNYKDEKGKFLTIENKIVAKKVDKFEYSNTGNDYKALFQADPNDGWKFVSPKGDVFNVTNVNIAGNKLNWDKKKTAILSGDTIT